LVMRPFRSSLPRLPKGSPIIGRGTLTMMGLLTHTIRTRHPTAYTIAGKYDVTLIVRGNDFRTNTSTRTQYITVRPLNSFNASVTSGKAPLAVQFNDTSTGSPTSWAWNFGDGATSTSQNLTYIFNTAGVYPVTLVATGSAVSGSPAATRNITVYPDADFIAVPQSGIYPLTVRFTDKSIGSPTPGHELW